MIVMKKEEEGQKVEEANDMANNRIRETRHERGMSQQELSVRAGTGPAIITLVEKHGHLPGEDLRHRIAEALEVTEETLWPELAKTATSK